MTQSNVAYQSGPIATHRAATGPLWIEAALNGGWGSTLQPQSPLTIAQIIEEGKACARAGAAIIHVHAFDDAGRPSDDSDIYAAIIEGIRADVDAIVYPTITFGGDNPHLAVEQLCRRGLLQWFALDTGSVNISRLQDIKQDRTGSIYQSTETMMHWGFQIASDYGVHPSHACYEPGFVRMAAAIARRYPDAPQSIYRLMFSDGLAFGFPPRPYALEAYLELLSNEAPTAPVMIAGLDADLTPIWPAALAAGVHIRVGLEDAPLGTPLSNLDLVDQLVRHFEGNVASAAEIRASLARAPVASTERVEVLSS